MGEVDEDKINNMSFVFFNDVLNALGKRLNFDSMANLLGNSFCKDSGDLVSSLNPLVKRRQVSMFDSMDVQIEKEVKKTEEIADAFDDIEKMFSLQVNVEENKE